MMEKIVNLTPHEVVVFDEDGGIIATIPSAGVARATQSNIALGELAGIPLVQTMFGEVVGLPEPSDDTYYIVSVITLSAARANGRTVNDLLITTDMVRDEDGRIVGCRALARA